MQIALSNAVLARIRHHLRRSIPDIPASRMAEALAAALGFGTNAALVAGIESRDRSKVLMAEVVPSAFGMRLADMGMPSPMGRTTLS